MKMKKHSTAIVVLTLLLHFSILFAPFPPAVFAQMGSAAAQSSVSELEKRLSRIESKVESRRKELGIPGMSLAIVKDGKVIYSKGLGYRNFEKKIPVTASTQFAIGSASKAFTALSLLMLQDEGKVSLDDAPRKYLPYFKINNTKTNAAIQVRDLLAHSSGLNRTDLAMITGKLSREELIKVAGIAKPVAELREKFLYQNIMYAAAGEIVAKIENRPWEEFVPERIFAPLGMNNSTMSVDQFKASIDHSLGYSYNFDTKETRNLPTREIKEVSPAGSINSSADDMAKWLQFILAGGEAGGKRLLSQEGFEEWLKPQMKITPDGKVSYGLGWFIQDWKGKKVVQHGGNIDGFNSMVALLPEENLGFVMLTNVTASPLGNELMQLIWSGMLEDISEEKLLASDDAKKEAGTYNFAEAGFDVQIEIEDGSLVMKVPGQPTYVLENVEGRKYKLSNAPDGFFITFKDGEAFLEQPQGNFTLRKEGAAPKPAADDGSAKELIGKYESEQQKGNFVEIKDVSGKASLVVASQPPYPLVKSSNDEFRSPSLPETYAVRARRSADKKITGIVIVQPEGEFGFTLVPDSGKKAEPMISADEVYAKMIDALGGEAAWKKLTSREMKLEIDFVHQGVTAKGSAYSKAPNLTATSIELFALGKKIGWIREYFDGTSGGEAYSFGPEESYTGQRLEDVKFNADFYGYLDTASKIKGSEVTGIEKIGEEEAYKLVIEPEKATAYTLFVSKRTFLPVRRQFVVVSSTTSQRIPVTETYSDYRKIDGVMIPFRMASENSQMGELVTVVKELKHNVKIADEKFRK